jgi:hypothetical protein
MMQTIFFIFCYLHTRILCCEGVELEGSVHEKFKGHEKNNSLHKRWFLFALFTLQNISLDKI